ncbi:MAG: hypothetical protein OEL87_00530 [Nanoarchaeota archaeon]|nr:hypothetical protein [Nanoarchaeota archaeon]
MESIKDYWIKKLLFPKVFIVDKPGIIISKVSSKFGNKENKRRMIFLFEDILINLQLETTKKLGKAETSKLWYKIGKDIGTRYILSSKTKKINKSLMPIVIRYIFSSLRANGMSICEKIVFKDDSLTLEGKDNIVWRKTRDGSVFAGLVSGILGPLFKENIEAKWIEKNGKQIIIANKNISRKYIPNFKELLPSQQYDTLNFPEDSFCKKQCPSFNDFVKFKKIDIRNGKNYLKSTIIIPSEIGLSGIVKSNYYNIKEEKLLEKVIISSAEEVYEKLFKNKENLNENLKSVKNVLCALGWGIPFHRISKKHITFSFLYPPLSKYEFTYQALVLNGFLNRILKKKFKIKNMKIDNNSNTIEIRYERNDP